MDRQTKERIEGTTDTKAIKGLKDALLTIAADMKSEGFTAQDFHDYINEKRIEAASFFLR